MSASTTATEEDTEQLRDLVAATLEKEGILGKIKAQLRSLQTISADLKMFKILNLIWWGIKHDTHDSTLSVGRQSSCRQLSFWFQI